MTAPLTGKRWVVVAEEELVPVDTGCRVDHVGFLRAATSAGVELEVVVPLPAGRTMDGYANALPPLHLHGIPRDASPLRHLSPLPYVVASRPAPIDLGARVTARGPVDAVVSYSVRSAEIGRALAAELAVPHLVRCQNLDSAYFASLRVGASPVRGLAYAMEAFKLRRYERELDSDPAVSAFADVSAEEAAGHRTRTSTTVLHVPSFALDLGDAPDAAPERSGVLFLGSLDVETNQQALEWLLGDIWPKVLAEVPGSRLSVVGRRPTDALRATVGATEGAELHADVPSVAPYLAAAAIVVNPVRTGAGINVKLLQGMAAGAAAVSSTVGSSGLDWVPGEHLLVADDTDTYVAAIVGLLRDDARREAMAAAGAAHVRSRLDPLAGVTAFDAALAPVTIPADPFADAEAVIVSWKSLRHLEELLPTLPASLRVAVVDNSPGAEDLAPLVASRPLTRLVPDGPGGFAGGANLGASTSSASLVVFVNPDSRPSADVLAALLADVRSDDRLSGAGPLTRTPDGRIEIGVGGWEPSLGRALVHAAGLHTKLPEAGMVARPGVRSAVRLDWVSGACLAVRRLTFLDLGGFDESTYMYSEDMAYGVAGSRRGLRSRLRTDLVVPHEGGGSGAPKTYNARLMGGALGMWLQANKPAPVALLVRLVLALGMLARVPLYLATGRRAQAREGLAYVSGLRAAAPPPRP